MWISVEERLPENSGMVHVKMASGFEGVGHWLGSDPEPLRLEGWMYSAMQEFIEPEKYRDDYVVAWRGMTTEELSEWDFLPAPPEDE